MMNIKTEKGQKRKLQFGETAIDNAAPVNKIISDLHRQNPKAAMLYFYNLRPRAINSPQIFHDFVLPGHPINSFPTDWEGGLNYQYFEKFTYRSLMPKMITPIRHLDKNDPVTAYMNLKTQWHKINNTYKKLVGRCKKYRKFEKLNDEVMYGPKLMVNFAQHLESDPLPYFESAYNWNYAGNGNMQQVCVDYIDYILHSEFSTVYLTRFHMDNLKLDFNDSVSFDCGDPNNILETICSTENIVVVRTMNKIFILKIVKNCDKIHFEKLKIIESQLPYTGINFDGYHKNILYVVTLDSKLTIINLDRLTGRSVTCRYSRLLNNWNTVIGSERSYYTHVVGGNDGGCITIYDKRTNYIVDKWQNMINVCDLPCNVISTANQKENTPFMYLGTNHHLLMMDLRSMPKSPRPVQRWTHGMHCVPTYISRCNFELGKELICLSSQWCEDMCVVPNYIERPQKEHEIMGVTIPYRPPNVLSTLKLARQNLLCHDVYNRIDKRLSTTITGVLAMEQADKFVVLMHNSLGDITSHVLYPQHLEEVIEDDGCIQLEEWGKFNKVENKKFVVSDVVDITKLWKKLIKMPDDYNPRFDLPQNVPSKFDEAEIVKAFENKELDAGLLDIWTNEGGSVNQNDTDCDDNEDTVRIIDDEDSIRIVDNDEIKQ